MTLKHVCGGLWALSAPSSSDCRLSARRHDITEPTELAEALFLPLGGPQLGLSTHCRCPCSSGFLLLMWGKILNRTETNLRAFLWLRAVLCFVSQSCLILCDPMNCSPPYSSVLGILQARILEWVAFSFSRGSSQARDQNQVSRIADGFFTI